MKVSLLEDILAYHHNDLVETFMEKYSVSTADAEDIFRETLKMLWLMGLRREEETLGLSPPEQINVYPQMNILDEMWHSFILFSKSYSSFCKEYCGGYLHHLPTTPKTRKRFAAMKATDPKGFDERYSKEIETQCRYICAKLGPDTLTKWFKEFPSRFPSFRTSAPAVGVRVH